MKREEHATNQAEGLKLKEEIACRMYATIVENESCFSFLNPIFNMRQV